jgi:predicted nucleic acid-binding protein
MAARQVLTHQWWEEERGSYELVTSQYVIDEAAQGDPVLAAERLEMLDGISLLPLDRNIDELAAEIISQAILPPTAQVDALHIATVAYHRIEYLLTWNCRHIANGKILSRIHRLLVGSGIPIPIICTPEELLAYGPDED